jgi:hypothetical protein
MLENLARLGIDCLSPRIDTMFASCDDFFFDLASRAKNNRDQNLYFESLREIRTKKSDITSDFRARFNVGFLSLPQLTGASDGENPRTARTPESLELVGNEELEKDVVVIDMVSNARQEWQDELFQLKERIQSLAGRRLEDREMPIDPERIARAFINACNLIQADIKILKLLYKQFDRHVMRKLDDLYALSNQLLVEGEVLPDLKPLSSQTQKRKPATSPEKTPAPAVTAPATSFGLDGIPESEPQMRELAQLLVRLRNVGVRVPDGAVADATPATSGSPISREELVSMISEVQGQPKTEGADTRPLDIRQAIGTIVQTRGNFSVGQTDEDIINVIAMFFDLVLDDRNLPAEIKALVGRLQLPILRVALIDRSFFTDRKHPARQLINEIARTSMGWDSSDKDSQDELFVRLTALVDEILLASSEDPGVFERSLSTLLGFIERSEQRASKAVRRTTERALADARTTKARDMARHVLHERLESRQLPAEVTAFLVEDWLQVLQLVYLKNGKDGVEWNTAVQVADDLLWSVEPHRDDKSRRRLERLLPSLYDRIAVGLDQTQSTQEDARARIEVIRRVHRALSGLAPEIAAPVAPLSPEQRRRITPMPSPDEKAWREMTAVERQRVQHEALMFEYLKRADEVPVGTWFEYDDLRQSITRRCKLATRIDENQSLIFVNRMGVQVYEKPRKAFAYDLQMGHARPVEDAPLFDRTVDRIASNLRKLAGE